jgi:hypothetical protein
MLLLYPGQLYRLLGASSIGVTFLFYIGVISLFYIGVISLFYIGVISLFYIPSTKKCGQGFPL